MKFVASFNTQMEVRALKTSLAAYTLEKNGTIEFDHSGGVGLGLDNGESLCGDKVLCVEQWTYLFHWLFVEIQACFVFRKAEILGFIIKWDDSDLIKVQESH